MKCIVCGRKIAKDEDICHVCKDFFKWKRKWDNKREKNGLSYLRKMKRKRNDNTQPSEVGK